MESNAAVLWYVHDHGLGHLNRCLAVLPHLSSRVVVASARPDLSSRVCPSAATAVELPTDHVDETPRTVAGPWHYAPEDGVTTRRTGALIDAIRAHGCTTAVIDVSVETAVLCRLAGLRVVSLRQTGRRDDAAHRIGFASANVVWVPQHRALEPIDMHSADAGGDGMRLSWSGAFSRFDTDEVSRSAARSSLGVAEGEQVLVVVVGQGGTRFPVAAWAESTVEHTTRVVILGLDAEWSRPGVRSLGRVEQIFTWLVAADVVVSSAGWASVHDAVAAGTRLAVVVEERPFQEQVVRAAELQRRGLVQSLAEWPMPGKVDALVEAMSSLDPHRWDEFYDGRGAQRAASMIDELHAA